MDECAQSGVSFVNKSKAVLTKYLDMETQSQAQICLDVASPPATSHITSPFSSVNGTALNTSADLLAQ